MARVLGTKAPATAQHGVVVKFDADKGFGFIRPQNGDSSSGDIFVHVRNVEGRHKLMPGQSVTYYVTRTDKGLAAIKVQPGSILSTPYLKFAVIGFGLALVILLALAVVLGGNVPFGIYVGLWIAALSIVSFFIYGYDKAQAQSGGTRVPELILHALSLCGGSLGSFFAMRSFRHKTSKPSFQIVFWIIVGAQIALLLFWALRR